MTRRAIIILALPLILSVLVLPHLYADDSSDGEEREIRAALEDWTEDFNLKRTDKVCGLFAPDLIANYGDYPQRDYDSICNQLKISLTNAETTFSYALEINEIIVSGDLAVVRLIWTLNIYDAGGKLVETSKDRGMDLFRRQADGKWRISRYIAYPMGGK